MMGLRWIGFVGVFSALSAFIIATALLVVTNASATALVGSVVSMHPLVAAAEPAAPSAGIAVPELVDRMRDAVRHGQWPQLVALALLFLVALIGKTWGMVKDYTLIKPYLKWIAMLLAAVVGGATACLGDCGLVTVIIAALGSGVGLGWSAVGANETIVKPLLQLFSVKARDEAKAIKAAKRAVRKGSLKLSGAGMLHLSPDETR